MKKAIFRIIFILFVCGIFYSTYNLFMWQTNINKNKIINIETKKQVKTTDNKVFVDFNELKKTNKDVVAYLRVKDTRIDYVVVKGKDNSYYLNHNLKKDYNIAGWIFMDFRNKLDGTDKNIVIFGHNMKDGSMFGSLKKVLKKEWYNNNSNLDILFITEKKQYTYRVFSTYSIKPEAYYIKTGFKDNNEYTKFLNKIKSRSIYDYNEELNENDRILTLSSCIGDGSNRVVLHAKRIKEQ